MKTAVLFVFLVASTLGDESQMPNSFSYGNTQFTAEVYKKMLNIYPDNFLMCPVSVRVILALAHAGARGNTANELANALHFPNDKSELGNAIAQLLPYLQNSNKYILASANKIYLANTFTLSNQFRRAAIEVFGADAQNIDFTQRSAAATEMNRWVQEKTYDKIKNLIKSDSLNSNTVAVLINAMYFKGTWLNQFDSSLTDKKAFSLDNGTKVYVDMMKIRDEYNYYNHPLLKAQFLELPYEGDDVTMNIILPNQADGLAELETHIDEILTHSYYYKADVDVQLPRFNIETNIDFKKILQTLGMSDAFDVARADFKALSVDQRDIFISEIIQKSFIEVTEQGTTAGAASGVYFEERSFPHIFNADHPFLFFLKHKVAGILFVGRLSTPEGSRAANEIVKTNRRTSISDFDVINVDQERIWAV